MNKKLVNKIKDRMLLGSIYDNIMLKTRYKGEHLNFNYNVMMGQKHRMLYYKRLKRKYLDKVSAKAYWEDKETVYNNDQIWICWFQGLEKAPDLVKICVDSVKKNLPGKNITIITMDNYADYVKMPDHIIEKFKKGIISYTFFSDLVRLELLTTHGGYWIDSTVFLSGSKLFDYIDKMDFFAYSFYYFGFNPEIMTINNWLMKSGTNNNILSLTKELLYAYWKDYNRALDYFINMLFMTMAVDYYKDEFNKMPIVSQVNAHVLATYMGENYDELKWNLLKEMTDVHKLSNKFTDKETSGEGTFYKALIKGELS